MKNRSSKVRLKLLDKHGVEVPSSEYDLDLDKSDFTIKLKKSRRGGSNEKFSIVLANEAGEDSVDVNVTFLGE